MQLMKMPLFPWPKHALYCPEQMCMYLINAISSDHLHVWAFADHQYHIHTTSCHYHRTLLLSPVHMFSCQLPSLTASKGRKLSNISSHRCKLPCVHRMHIVQVNRSPLRITPLCVFIESITFNFVLDGSLLRRSLPDAGCTTSDNGASSQNWMLVHTKLIRYRERFH